MVSLVALDGDGERRDPRYGRIRLGLRLVVGVGLENGVAQAVVCADVAGRTQQREAASLTVDGVLPGGERDVPVRSVNDVAVPVSQRATFPHREPDQLQAGEWCLGEVQFDVGELSRRVP